MEEVRTILEGLFPDVDFEKETHLVEDRMLRSFDVIAITRELCEHFDIEIEAVDLVPENFNSLAAISAMVERKEDE